MTTQELRNKVDKLEAELKAVKDQLDKQLKINGFEIDYEDYCFHIWSQGTIEHTSDYDVPQPSVNPAHCNFGTYRKTKELAEIASNNMRARNKLEELVHWLEPDWKPDWNNNNQRKCYIYYVYDTCKFKYHYLFDKIVIGAVFMSEQTAVKICNALNDGLLPELAEILKGK